jgi:aminocarboxymuconate-semialdehyde decarboxylase
VEGNDNMPTTRRNLLAGTFAGMTFCGCGLSHGARAQPTIPSRLPVTVSGQTVQTIDVHSHCFFHEAVSLMGNEAASIAPPINGGNGIWIEPADRMRTMDAMAIDTEVLSVNPFWYEKHIGLAERICAIQNDKLAHLCAAYPTRFAAFASLTLQDPVLAARQLETAMQKQGLKGAAIGDRVANREFSDPAFDPVWAKAEELGAVLFIHPQGVPELNRRLAGNGWLTNLIGYPLGTTIALEHMIFQGTFDKFPNLKVVAAHGGGYVASYAARMDHACSVGPCDPNIKLKKAPTEYLNQIYYDALVFTPEALRHLAAQVGTSQLMLGTDCPYPWELHPVDRIFEATWLTPDQRAAILGGNATRLFGFKA